MYAHNVVLKSPIQTGDNEKRFYTHCSAYPYEPTRDRLAVRQSDEMGEGLASLIELAVGDVVFRFSGSVLRHQTLYTLQKAPGIYIEDPFVMGKVLHSCDPNMTCDMTTLTFRALKPIKAGDYLTMDYETTEDELFRKFFCCCGSLKCRGQIGGRIFLKNQCIPE